ncbi:MAG: hypothetical protein LBT78_01910 [Tannerella sp.]|nr:hypothetical protein [Tannerella sp.]
MKKVLSLRIKIDTLLDEAMAQIHDRRYYEMYLDRKVTLMGVAFTGKEVKYRLEAIVAGNKTV